MDCKKNEKFTVLTFSTVKHLAGLFGVQDVNFEWEQVIEIAAVKIKRGQIAKHFSSFIALDGYDMHRFEFKDYNFNLNGICAEHLIGAPTLEETAKTIKAFVGDDTVIVKGNANHKEHPYQLFITAAEKFGVIFDNDVLDIELIHQAVRLQVLQEDEDRKFEETTPLEIAEMLAPYHDNWTDIFLDYNVSFDTSEDAAWTQDRSDPLSWALAFAKFLINLLELNEKSDREFYDADEEEIQLFQRERKSATDTLDNDCPFDV
jgi:hypothetical protein